MRELAGRMQALDPVAGAALQVVAHFDALVDARAGLEATVRAAAVLGGCPAGMVDRARRLRVRVLPDGRRADGEPAGIVSPVSAGSDDAVVWLERPAEPEADPARAEFDSVLVDRLATTVRIVLDRTWSSTSAVDPAAVELLVDPAVDDATRTATARRLGWAADGAFVLTVGLGGAGGTGRAVAARLGDLEVTIEPADRAGGGRGRWSATAGPVAVPDLPAAYRQARLALRLTSAGTDEPGPAHVDVAALGGLLALAEGCDSPAAITEVALLERVTSTHPWALATLTAVAAEPSLRAAALALHVHHSTLQGRVELLDHALGYPVTTPDGRTRLTVALALRRLRRNRW